MKDDTAKWLRRSEECLEEAQQLLENDHYLGTVNRAYYCIFDSARALLFENGLFAKTHQGVHAKFNELFIKNRIA